jgi:hypothetical protein
MQRSMVICGMLAALVLSAGTPTTAAAGANVDQLPDATATQLVDASSLTKPTGTGTDVVVGQLVDSECNMVMAKITLVVAPEHLKCAITCAQKGGRLAVVTSKGDVYRVIGVLTQSNNAKLIQFVNQNVTITGTIGTITASLQPATGTVDAVVLQPSTKVDTRRPSGSEAGVVVKTTFRKGDFREGDVPASTELSIDAASIDLAPKIGLVP